MSKHNYKLPFPAIPDMPPEIINAIDDGDLLLFVGAGVSKLIGYPLWFELGRNLAEKASDFGLISLPEKEILLGGQFSPMEIVTILCKKFNERNPSLGREMVIKELSPSDKIDSKIALKIANYLSAYNATIVTTNADESLQVGPLKGRIVVTNFGQFEFEKHCKYSIIHLHGDIRDPGGMVFTSEEYAKAYNVEADFGKNLKALFEHRWTILFMGYGVSEFELLRYFLPYKEDKVRRLFMLDGYLAKDRIKYEFDKEYYQSLGITLLPYSREKNDYKQLLRVLKRWDKDVKEKTLAASSALEENIAHIVLQRPFREGVEAIERMVNENG